MRAVIPDFHPAIEPDGPDRRRWSIPTSIAARDLPITGVIPEYRSKQLLAFLGVPFPAGGFAATLDHAQAIAAHIGYPVVLKAQAAALSYKSDAGGLILNIADDAALADARARLYDNVAAYDAGVTLDGALVEATGARGTELIVGARSDFDWGPVILVGLEAPRATLPPKILRSARSFRSE